MKFKFFISILMVFSVAIGLIVYSTTVFIRDERLRLIDQQIEQSTSSILATHLEQEQLEDLDKVEDLLYETLSLEPPNLYVQIFSDKGVIIYQNDLAKLIEVELIPQAGWQTTTENDHRLRSLTLGLAKSGQFLEVGLVLNRTDEVWEKASFRLSGYILVIFLFTALISFLLTQYLLAPIRQLTGYLTHLSSHVKSIESADSKKFRSFFYGEFKELIIAVEKLKNDIQQVLRDKSILFSQMTHELKTPLAILLNQVESLPTEVKETDKYSNIRSEIDYLSTTVQEFLDWSYIENAPIQSLETDAIKIGDFTEKLRDLVGAEAAHRMEVKVGDNFYVFAKMTLLKQVLINLMTNALKYSNGRVMIEVNHQTWTIRDSGPGISAKVIEKMGQPFNREPKSGPRSTGLGLAWVKTVCAKYEWELSINSSAEGTEIKIQFPEDKSTNA